MVAIRSPPRSACSNPRSCCLNAESARFKEVKAEDFERASRELNCVVGGLICWINFPAEIREETKAYRPPDSGKVSSWISSFAANPPFQEDQDAVKFGTLGALLPKLPKDS